MEENWSYKFHAQSFWIVWVPIKLSAKVLPKAPLGIRLYTKKDRIQKNFTFRAILLHNISVWVTNLRFSLSLSKFLAALLRLYYFWQQIYSKNWTDYPCWVILVPLCIDNPPFLPFCWQIALLELHKWFVWLFFFCWSIFEVCPRSTIFYVFIEKVWSNSNIRIMLFLKSVIGGISNCHGISFMSRETGGDD